MLKKTDTQLDADTRTQTDGCGLHTWRFFHFVEKA